MGYFEKFRNTESPEFLILKLVMYACKRKLKTDLSLSSFPSFGSINSQLWLALLWSYEYRKPSLRDVL